MLTVECIMLTRRFNPEREVYVWSLSGLDVCFRIEVDLRCFCLAERGNYLESNWLTASFAGLGITGGRGGTEDVATFSYS